MEKASNEISSAITEKAKSLGFTAVGYAKAELLEKESAHLASWLGMGYDADMKWIERGFAKRKDINLVMEGAKSVISLAFNYYTPIEHDPSKPKISRYAWGKDYHKILKKKLKELCAFIEETASHALAETHPPQDKESTLSHPPLTKGGTKEGLQDHSPILTKSYVDDGPVMDKAWAVKAGLGWMGKHTNVINPDFGSWFFIASIITNIEFEDYGTPIADLCGSCNLCLSACPTGAITEDYVVDANKCISYQTIENRGEIPKEINLDGWIFGCDVCQDVCPFNAPMHNIVTDEDGFYPKGELLESPLEKGDTGGYPAQFKTKGELEQITKEEFTEIFADSPVKRTKYAGWKRNLGRFLDIF